MHAVDVTNDPAHGMDTWVWAQIIAGRIIAGRETRVKYLVSNNGQHDVIFNPSVSLTWRLNMAEGGQSHHSHLHTSILYTAAAENDCTPYFVGATPAPPLPGDDDLTPEQDQLLREVHVMLSATKDPKTNEPYVARVLNGLFNPGAAPHSILQDIQTAVDK